MKNIPPSTLPHFHGMTSKEPDSFLYEFDILCHSYNYVRDAQKLKLFPRFSLKMVDGSRGTHHKNLGGNENCLSKEVSRIL